MVVSGITTLVLVGDYNHFSTARGLELPWCCARCSASWFRDFRAVVLIQAVDDETRAVEGPVEPLAAIAVKVEAEIEALPSTVRGWIEWLVDFMIAGRRSYAVLFGSAVETVKAIARRKKTGGESTHSEFACSKRRWRRG